jgi:phosphoesterase RecJ-like protein
MELGAERVAQLQQAGQAMRGKNVLIATHMNPDADACGSSLGLLRLLTQMDCTASVYCRDSMPTAIADLMGDQYWTRDLPENPGSVDVLCIVDCGGPHRVSRDLETWVETFDGTTVVLDHHIIDHAFGDHPCIYIDAAAAAEVVAAFADCNDLSIDRKAAIALYAGLMMDTGSFCHANTNAQVLRLASELAKAGADPHEISTAMFGQENRARLVLLGKVLDTLRVGTPHQAGAPTWASVILKESFWPSDAPRESIRDDFVQYPRSLQGVAIAFQVKERLAEGGCKISLRSTAPYNVRELAARFGGGGHEQAAGCFIETDIEAAHGLIQRAVEEELRSE